MATFLEKLANSNLSNTSSEHLKLLGKRAAGMYISKGSDSLTGAVSSAVEGENLNKDQIHRVVEMANQATWKELFHDGGETSSEFSPASSSDVLGSMSAKPDEISSGLGSLDFYDDVPNQNVPEDIDLSKAFGITGDDTPAYDSINPHGEKEESLDKVAAALDIARHGVDRILSDLVETGESLYSLIKQAHLRDDLGILQISKAVGEAVEDPTYAIALMKSASDRLSAEGVRFDQKGEIEKIAHPLVINTDHPLIKTAAIMEKMAYAYYASTGTYEDLKLQHAVAYEDLRSSMRGV